jgi:hypothetical protein
LVWRGPRHHGSAPACRDRRWNDPDTSHIFRAKAQLIRQIKAVTDGDLIREVQPIRKSELVRAKAIAARTKVICKSETIAPEPEIIAAAKSVRATTEQICPESIASPTEEVRPKSIRPASEKVRPAKSVAVHAESITHRDRIRCETKLV